MKKLFSILCLAAFLIAVPKTEVKAQSPVKMTVASADTLANTDTTSKIINVTDGWASLAIQPVVTKLSGTAAGVVRLYGSVDGVNYVATGDTLAISGTTSSTIWSAGVPKYAYYKIYATSSGTVSEVLNVWYIVRRYRTSPY